MEGRKFWLMLSGLLIVLALSGVSWLEGEAAALQPPASSLWRDASTNEVTGLAPQMQPSTYRLVALAGNQLEGILAAAPAEFTTVTQERILELPLPEGGYAQFSLSHSPIMEDGLAQRYPEIQTYSGQGVDDPSLSVRLDWSPNGFNALILSPTRTTYIAPYTQGGRVYHLSYDESALPELPFDPLAGEALLDELPGLTQPTYTELQPIPFSTGSQLRLYRTAISTTGEYGTANGGTIATVLASIVTRINQLNAAYELEFAIRLVLIDRTDELIYLNPATDPLPHPDQCSYTDPELSAQFVANQTLLDTTIGSANYDFGHIFMQNYCGGVVGGRVCNAGNKARGLTGWGTSNPLNTVKHEVGHGFNASHTWSLCNSGTGGQYAAIGAYEPGSGNTIMSYYGICGADNLPAPRVDRFHTNSFDQVMAYVTDDPTGSSCGEIVPTDNNPPIVTITSNSFTFPRNTPFTLSGIATDAEGDLLTYSWEELDLAPPAGTPPNSGLAPFFRVFPEISGSSRTFPQISDIVNNTTTLGELLPNPTISPENLTMRMHVRDNNSGSGGNSYSEISFDVTHLAGPFLVTSPNAGTEVWTPGGSELVTWDVAGTDVAPVSCATVNIALSTDGGYTYPFNLAGGVANDGSETIIAPNGLQTIQARIRVACAALPDHYFFDISNANFTVGTAVPPPACVTSLVVQSLADSGACSLRDTVIAAAPGSTITFSSALDGSTIYLASEILLNKNLTLDANGRDITVSGDSDQDGDGDVRVFSVQGVGVTIVINNLTIERGLRTINSTAEYGGGIRLQQATLTLNNVILQNNQAVFGGGIFQVSGTLNLNNSTVQNNTGPGAGLYKQGGNTNINSSTFSNNLSTGGAGGGIRVQFGSAANTLTVVNSTFSGNSTNTVGGGIYNSTQTLTVINSTFSGNSASSGGGGGIRHDTAGTMNLSNSIIANSVNGGDCSIADLATLGTNVANLIEDNTCSPAFSGDPNLGALANNGGWTQTHALFSPSNAIDNGDGATCAAAPINALDQRGYTRPATCDIGAFEHNATAPANAPTTGNAIFNVNERAANGTVVGTVTGSDPDGGSVTFAISGGNTDNAFTINPTSGQITVQRYQPLTFPVNPVFTLTVLVSDDDTPQFAAAATITINVTDINFAPAAQDATWTILNSTGNGTVVDFVRFSDLDPDDGHTFSITGGNTGGAFAINALSGDITVVNNSGFGSNPTFNLTVQVMDDGSPILGDAAAITIQVSQCITNLVTSIADSGPCTLRQTITDASPGATIRFASSIAGQSIFLASQLTLNKNLTIDGESHNITISGDTDNNGTGNVRVFNMTTGTIILQNLTIRRGHAGSASGGGIQLSGGNLTLNNCILSENRTANNVNDYGGGIYQSSGALTMNNCTVINNVGRGGGLTRHNGTTTVNNSTFIGNTSSGAGGGIRYENATGGGFTINNSTFSDHPGQAIWLNAGRVLTVNNSTFSGNGGGAAIGAGIRNDGTLYLRNSILANRTAGDDCSTSGTIAENINNIVEDGTCNVGTILVNFLAGDPNLGGPQNNGGTTQTFALISPSIAINSGDNTICSGVNINGLDQRGYLRNDGSCDRGAYEFNAPPGTAIWDGGGSTNNWSEAANWAGDVVPVAASTALFNSTSSKNATVGPAFAGTIAHVNIATGYAGTVSLGRSLAVNGNLSVADGAILDLSTQTLTVEGTVTNNGTLQQTRPATSVGVTVQFLRIRNAAATLTKYYGVDITPTASSLGDVTVTIQGNQTRCTTNGNDRHVARCYEVTPQTNAAATVRFYFSNAERNSQSANVLRIFHYGITGWETLAGSFQRSESDIICTSQNGQACWAEGTATSFSAFLLGSGGTPAGPGDSPTSIGLRNIALAHRQLYLFLLMLFGAGLVGTSVIVRKQAQTRV